MAISRIWREHHRAERAEVVGQLGHLAAVAEQLAPSPLREADGEALAAVRGRKGNLRARGLAAEADQLAVLAAAEALPRREVERRLQQVGLSGGVFAADDVDARRERDRRVFVIAEIGQRERIQYHI